MGAVAQIEFMFEHRAEAFVLTVTNCSCAVGPKPPAAKPREIAVDGVLVEGIFGQAAQNYHFKRSRHRRFWRHCIQDHLIAAVQNIKEIVQHAAVGRITTGSAGGLIIRSESNRLCLFLRALAALRHSYLSLSVSNAVLA